ncbi:MAG: 50S ribosomal protein L10 [Verrucomicrobiota bacterium]
MRFEKQQLVNDIKEILDSTEHLFMVGYNGLRVSDLNKLREQLGEKGAECHVVPNMLFQKAAAETKFSCLNDDSVVCGDNAVIAGGEDAVVVAKTLKDFSKECDALSLKCGCLGENYLDTDEIVQLAELPSREQLLSQLLSVLQAPSRNLVSLLNTKVATIVYALNAYLDKKQNQQ